MADVTGFAFAIAHDGELTEADIAVAVAWFLKVANSEKVSLASVCGFIESHGIRSAINKSRLRTRLKSRRDIAASDSENISIPLKTMSRLNEKYGTFLTPPPPKIDNNVLNLEDFGGARPYVRALARQVNGCRQFEFFDACAVMMRRLAEVLIIDAYEAKGLRTKILNGGNYQMLSGLVGALTSGTDFKLSRNAPRWIERLKELGDNAAHSRTYITKALDIDEFKGPYRNLISELASLAST